VPVVSIPVEWLHRLVGHVLTREELITNLERLGNDVEGYAVVARYRCDTCGATTEVLEESESARPRAQQGFRPRCAECDSPQLVAIGWSEVIRINLLPVRPDMFDPAGLARALRSYLGIDTGMRTYRFAPSGYQCTVHEGLESIRPFIVCCVARDLALDDELVRILMKLQENLHWALGRNRRRASIGMYDLDKVQPDFQYRPVEPAGVKFIPLGGMPDKGWELVTPQEILETHPKGRCYRHLLQHCPAFPLLCDAQGRVLSLPPIINSHETRVTEKTRNLFIDVTGPDKNAVHRTLDIVAAALADMGAKIETVAVRYPDGRVENPPDMTPGTMTLDPKRTVSVLGVALSPEDIAGLLRRMGFDAELPTTAGPVVVRVPAFRTDVMHQQDLIEDVAIAYGYHRIEPKLVPTMTIGKPLPIEELSETYRRVLTGLGFLETLSLQLTNPEEHLVKVGLPATTECVTVANPASAESKSARPLRHSERSAAESRNPFPDSREGFLHSSDSVEMTPRAQSQSGGPQTQQVILRRHLLSGLLGLIRANTTAPLPQQLFEIGDCYELDATQATGVRTVRRLAASIVGPKAGFAAIRATVETLAHELGWRVRFAPWEQPTFISGRAAQVIRAAAGEETPWGIIGEVHPEVLTAFNIAQPVVLAELVIA